MNKKHKHDFGTSFYSHHHHHHPPSPGGSSSYLPQDSSSAYFSMMRSGRMPNVIADVDFPGNDIVNGQTNPAGSAMECYTLCRDRRQKDRKMTMNFLCQLLFVLLLLQRVHSLDVGAERYGRIRSGLLP